MLSRNLQVLVVDDLSAMRSLTVSLLRKFELKNVAGACNGRDALRLLASQPFDIVLADWNMPIMNGLQLLQAVRANPKLYKLPFLMITAEADRTRITEAIASGVSGMLIKPYTSVQLEERIVKALKCAPPKAPVSNAESRPVVSAPVVSSGVPIPANRPTILVVDDTPENLQLLVELFKQDYRTRVANNGMRALEICCSDTPPDLVLLDIMMPDIDGFEVARRMREHPSSETIPVIFVTALNTDDARMKGLSLGAIDFVTKPIDPNVLKPRVSNLLRYISLHKQLQSNYDTMEELTRLRANVDQMIRHDLRGPLASIAGLARNLITGHPGQQAEFAEQLHLIESSATQVLEMINVSSELFNIEAGTFKLNPRPVVMLEMINHCLAALQATFSGKEVSTAVRVEPNGANPRVLGDPVLCYSAFNNLLKNAFEAAPQGSQIVVVVFHSSPVKISITNQGIVPTEIRDRFFEKYVTHGKVGGVGLGTYSAKRLTEAQHGTIELFCADASK